MLIQCTRKLHKNPKKQCRDKKEEEGKSKALIKGKKKENVHLKKE